MPKVAAGVGALVALCWAWPVLAQSVAGCDAAAADSIMQEYDGDPESAADALAELADRQDAAGCWPIAKQTWQAAIQLFPAIRPRVEANTGLLFVESYIERLEAHGEREEALDWRWTRHRRGRHIRDHWTPATDRTLQGLSDIYLDLGRPLEAATLLRGQGAVAIELYGQYSLFDTRAKATFNRFRPVFRRRVAALFDAAEAWRPTPLNDVRERIDGALARGEPPMSSDLEQLRRGIPPGVLLPEHEADLRRLARAAETRGPEGVREALGLRRELVRRLEIQSGNADPFTAEAAREYAQALGAVAPDEAKRFEARLDDFRLGLTHRLVD